MAAEAKVTARINGDQSHLEGELNKARGNVRQWAAQTENSTKDLFKTPHVNLLHISRGLVTAFSVGGIIEGLKSLSQAAHASDEASIKAADHLGVTLEKYDQWKEKAEAMKMPLEELAQLVERIHKHHGTDDDVDNILGTGKNPSSDTKYQSIIQKNIHAEKSADGSTLVGRNLNETYERAKMFFSGDWESLSAMNEGYISPKAQRQEGWDQHVKDNANRFVARDEAKTQAIKDEASYEENLEKYLNTWKAAEQKRSEMDAEFSRKRIADANAREEKAVHDYEKGVLERDEKAWRKQQRLDGEIDRIRVPGTEAEGLGAIGGYTGANFDKGAMAAQQRQTMIDKLERIAKCVEE